MPADHEQFERVILDRLHRVEARHARLRWVVVILLVAIVWREFAYHPVVRADRFELVDVSGEVRGLWQVRNDGAALLLRQTDGWRVELSGDLEGGALRIFGPADTTEARISSGATATTLQLLSGIDKRGVARIDSDAGSTRVRLTPSEGAATVIPDPAGNERE